MATTGYALKDSATGAIPVAQGGTGATSAANARDALGISDILATLEDSAAQQQIDIITLAAAASVTPLTPSNTVADTFTDSNGYLNTETSATANYNSTSKAYDNTGLTLFAPSATGTYYNVGCNAGTVRKAAQQFTLSDTTVIDAVQYYISGKTGSPGDATLRIETNNSGNPSGSLADAGATKTIAEGSITTTADNLFVFASPVTLSAGTYYIVFSAAANTGTNNYSVSATTSVNGGRYYDGTWHSDGTYGQRSGYRIVTSATTNVVITLGSQTGNTIQGLYAKSKSTGTVTYDYSFDGGSNWTTSQALNSYVDVGSVTGLGAGNNLIRFQLATTSTLTAYAVVLFYG